MADITSLSDAELLAQLSQHLNAGQAQPASPDANLPETLQLGVPFTSARFDTRIPLPPEVAAMLVGGGKSASRILQGVQQMLPGDRPELAAKVAEENRLYGPLAQAHPFMTGLGESLPAFTVPIGGAGSLASTMGRTALATALPGALEYGTPQERAQRAAIGGAAGAGGALLGYGLGRLVNPVRSANPLATGETQALADAAGIQLTPGQATGSKALTSLEGTLGTFPGSAGYMAKVQQAQREGFNRAALGLLGEPPASSIANDAALLARQGIGNRLEQAAAGVTVKLDDPFLNQLGAVESKYMKVLTADQKPFIRNAIDSILGVGDAIPGDVYQTWRSRIGARAASTSDSEFKGALKGIQSALDSAFDRSAGPEASAAMTAARGQYRNFKTLEPLLEKAAMSSSNVPPAQVESRALATGNTQGAMQSLAQLGQTIGRDYPNSGTAPRILWQSIFENPLRALNPLLSIGGPTSYGVARFINSPAGRAYLTNSLITPARERALTGLSGLLGYAGSRALTPP